MAQSKTTTLCIKGMHCPSCDILIKSKFKEISNIRDVKPNYQTQQAEIMYTGELNKSLLNKKILQFGYQVVDSISEPVEPLSKRLTDASIIAIILFILYFFAQEFNLLPDLNITSSLTFSSVFILGLVASTSTCMATSGALFLSTIGKLNNSKSSFKENIIPAISFNLGRVLSYGFFGFLFGLLGKTLASNLQLGTLLSIFVSVMMILVGLDMLKLFSITSILPIGFNKGLFEKLEHRFIKSPKKTSFFLGAITYLLPCGFTQAVQIYALGLASPVQSALLMMIFALGTVPALLAIGYASSFTKSSYYPVFQKAIGVLIFAIGLSYILNTSSIYGYNLSMLSPNTIQAQANDPNVKIENGYQVVKMNVNAKGYEPSNITVKQGIPVKWIINGENVFGCQGSLIAPKAGIQAVLKTGENIYEFTPKDKGPLSFSCSMGMVRGQFNVI